MQRYLRQRSEEKMARTAKPVLDISSEIKFPYYFLINFQKSKAAVEDMRKLNDWLAENCEGQWASTSKGSFVVSSASKNECVFGDEDYPATSVRKEQIVVLFFEEESDAVNFKLTHVGAN